MSHPTLWPKEFYYPVGNTAAVCLTDNLPPEKSANVLLLGCGDPRNILYTLYADPLIHRPVVEFTCCDLEPAVIARNVLLFTLVYDDHPSNRIWDIFYHLKVDKTSFALLISQCKRLLNISRDLESWQKSSYSKFLKFCSRYTLSQVHQCLGLYAQTEAYSRAKHDKLFSSFTREFHQHHGPDDIIPDVARSAGLFSMNIVQMLSKHFYHYWETGTVSRSTADIAAATFVNPTFVYSGSFTPSLVGDRCSLHYGTYPLKGFHLAATFLTSSPKETVTEGQLVSCARSQFQQWCSAFRITTSRQSVTIGLFTGNALAFCQKLTHLQSASDVHLYVSPWKAAELVLDGDYNVSTLASFDTIDTSNLADHLGVLNVLIATVPLLAHNPTSVLYTEFVVDKDKGSKASNLVQLLCADIPTISVLLGISPAGCIAQFTSTTRVHEILGCSAYRERFAWKCPYSPDSQVTDGDFVTPSFADPIAMGNVLFGIYQQMFAGEDLRRITNPSMVTSAVIHYNRGTFAALLGLVKSRVQTDWKAVMEYIFHRLHNDHTLIMGSNNYQELCCQLYLRGVYCVEALGPQRTTLTPIDRGSSLFKGWKEVPPIVSLVLVVPREKIRMLEGAIGRQLGSPMFHCELRGRTFSNIFSCIRAVLGTALLQGKGSDARIEITEDPNGWSGAAPLVVSVCLPAFNLVIDGAESTQISLGLYSTPVTAGILLDKLGPRLNLFTTNILDTSAVHVTMNRNNCSPSVPTRTTSRTLVSVSIDGSRVSAISARWEPEISLKEVKVDHIQISPCVIEVAVDNNLKKNLVYPFAIDGTRAMIRIARKSGWIEVEAPVSPSLALPDLAITSLVVQNWCPIVWNIHRVNLEYLPIVEGDILGRQASTIGFNCFLSFSDREHALLAQKPVKNMLVAPKDTISQILVKILNSAPERIISLSDPGNGGVYTVLYLNGIRMDLASHTYVVDACVLPLTEKLLRGPLGHHIMAISSHGVKVLTPGAEVEAWKHLLVAFTERCRTWTHKTTCKYTVSGKIPVSTEISQNPLCGCGEGIYLDRLSLDMRWKPLAPLMTRAAISPLFAIPYLETVDKRLEKLTCAACGKPEFATKSKLLKCSRCKEVDYCGKACQVAHWKEHKKVCKSK